MTRGRKKDLTLTPSRALAQQRDYRARKAQQLLDLESRYRELEEENRMLQEENTTLRLDAAGIRSRTSHRYKLAEASSELLSSIDSASMSIRRFQHLAFYRNHDSTLSPQGAPSSSYHSSPEPSPSTRPSPESLNSPQRFPSTPISAERLLHQGREVKEATANRSEPPESLRKILCDPATTSRGPSSPRRLSQHPQTNPPPAYLRLHSSEDSA